MISNKKTVVKTNSKKAAVNEKQKMIVPTTKMTKVEKPVAPVLTPKKVESEGLPSINPTPSKRQLLERQRRRSSLSGLSIGRRRSSVGIGFTHDLPPSNVEMGHFHRHILPDLPGPVKMKQLLIWAVQSVVAGKEESEKERWEELISEPLTQGLHTNSINTSWYQRPNTSGTSMTTLRPNPVNNDMKECVGLYQRYHRQLTNELAHWKNLELNPSDIKELPLDQEDYEKCENFNGDLVTICKWLNRLPFHVDRLGWFLQVYGNFEAGSKQYCENVFHQIFDRFFAASQKPSNPIQVLKALSNAAPE